MGALGISESLTSPYVLNSFCKKMVYFVRELNSVWTKT